MQSEYYHLRRTAIKELAAYCGFLLGFLGSAPFAWELLASQLDDGNFARGLWYFFGIVTSAGIFAGIAGLGIGFVIGLSWEQIHRFRWNAHARQKAKTDAVKRSASGDPLPNIARVPEATGEQFGELPRLRLVTLAEPFPDLTGRKVSSVRFHARGMEIDFGGLLVEVSGNPVVTAGTKRFRYPEVGSRDAICSFIGMQVERMGFTQSDRTEIRFDAGWELTIARKGIAVA